MIEDDEEVFTTDPGSCIHCRRRSDLEAELEKAHAALRLIAAVPAFPSKDIADKALGSTAPEWEPKAKKEWMEKQRKAYDPEDLLESEKSSKPEGRPL